MCSTFLYVLWNQDYKHSQYLVWTTCFGRINRYSHYWVWRLCVGDSTDTHTTEFGDYVWEIQQILTLLSLEIMCGSEFGDYVWEIQQILTLLSLDIMCGGINRYLNYWVGRSCVGGSPEVWRFNWYSHYWVLRFNRYSHFWVGRSCVGESTSIYTTEFGYQQILTLLSLDIMCGGINRYLHYWVWTSCVGGSPEVWRFNWYSHYWVLRFNRYSHFWVGTSCVGESTDTHTTEFGDSTDTHTTEFGHHVWGDQGVPLSW